MEIITSADNQRVKTIKKLYDKKHRDKTGLYIAEGVRWITDAASLNPSLIETVVLRESNLSLADKLNLEKSKVIAVSDTLFNKISELENSQGVLAVLKQARTSDFVASDYCLFLDKVRDPGNLGTIIRTACAAGYTDIICNDCADIYNPKTIRSSMTAILSVNVHYSDVSALVKLKNDGYKVFSGVLDGDNIFELGQKPQKLCIVIGNEADGISDEIKIASDFLVKIPMQNVESLNAAVSAGILMYLLKF